jgi:hypothetical protein
MIRTVLIFLIGFQIAHASSSPYGPYGSTAIPISSSHDYFQKTPDPDYWALSPYYVGQSGGGASSVASMLMILNFAKANLRSPVGANPSPNPALNPASTPIPSPAAIAASNSASNSAGNGASENHFTSYSAKDLPSPSASPLPFLSVSPVATPSPQLTDQEMIDQDALLRKTNEAEWTRNAANPGSSMTLDQLAHVVEQACIAFGFPQAKATAYHAHKTEAFKKTLHEALLENKRTHDDFILANYNESAFVGEVDIDHVSPVGAYDAARKRVLIMETDRQWYEPYWVSEETFLDGMATADKITGMARGFIWLKLR